MIRIMDKLQILATDIREHRIQAQLKQLELAKSVDIAESYISLIERGKRRPGKAVLKKLVHRFYPGGNSLLLDHWMKLAGFKLEHRESVVDHSASLIEREAKQSENLNNANIQLAYIRLLIRKGVSALAKEEAKRFFERFCEDTIAIQSLTASMELLKGNFEGAIKAHKQSITSFKSGVFNTTLKLPDLEFNLAVCLFKQAELSKQEAKNQKDLKHSLQQFQASYQVYQNVLEQVPQDLYLIDEITRVSFVIANLQSQLGLRANWQAVIDNYKQVVNHPQVTDILGYYESCVSSSFLAYTHVQIGDLNSAESMLSMIQIANPSFWLAHFLKACVLGVKYKETNNKTTKRDIYSQCLATLKQALQCSGVQNKTRQLARQETVGDLQAIHQTNPTKFNKIIGIKEGINDDE